MKFIIELLLNNSIWILLLGGIATIIGFLILAKVIKIKNGEIYGYTLILLSVLLFLIVILDDIGNVVMAWATVALVLATFLTLNENRRLRSDALIREKREYEDKLLKEVTDWAEEFACCTYIEAAPLFDEARFQLTRFRVALSKKARIRQVIYSFGDNKFNEFFNMLVDEKGNLYKLLDGLQYINNIQSNIKVKTDSYERKLKILKEPNLDLLKDDLEFAQFHINAGRKWLEMDPLHSQLQKDINEFLEYVSNIRVSLISKNINT
jgi:hypothetical protein